MASRYKMHFAVVLIALTIGIPISTISVQAETIDVAFSFGTKVLSYGSDLGRPLCSFPDTPKIAFVDANLKGRLDSEDPIYIHFSTKDAFVCENDIRMTQFSSYSIGSQVAIDDKDFGYPLSFFGQGFPNVQVRYFDVTGDEVYGIEDPVYLDFNPGSVSAGDIRLTRYYDYQQGTRVDNSDTDNGKPTLLLSAVVSFFNANGNIDILGRAVYDKNDVVYIDTQRPFYKVTINDVRVSSSI